MEHTKVGKELVVASRSKGLKSPALKYSQCCAIWASAWKKSIRHMRGWIIQLHPLRDRFVNATVRATLWGLLGALALLLAVISPQLPGFQPCDWPADDRNCPFAFHWAPVAGVGSSIDRLRAWCWSAWVCALAL